MAGEPQEHAGQPEREAAAPAAAPRSNRVAALVLFVAIAGAPLPFGSRDPTTVAFWCFLLGVGLLFVSPRHLRGPHLALLAGIAFVVAGYGFVLHEQLADHPWIASPHPIWAQASELLGKPIKPSVSIVRDDPLYALGAPLSALLALILGLVVGADRPRARQALLVMAWAGAAYAVYGILSLLLDPGTILWREKTAYVGSLTATFINRNTAATYFGSCAAVWLVLLMESVRGRLPRGPIAWRKALGYILTDTPPDLAIRFVVFFVCLAALFMTGSRGGVIFSLLVLVIAFVLFFRRDLPRGKNLIVAVVAAGAMALILLQLMGGNVGQRIDASGLADAGRLSAWRSTLRIIADNPWFGTGLGTFAWAFPPYRSADISMQGVFDLAHSTPLELAAELGIPLACVVAIAWLVALAVLARALRGARRNSGVALAALAVSLIALLHSSIDFSLQMTGYAIVAFALVGVGLAQSFNAGEEPSPRRRRTRHAEAAAATRENAEAIVGSSYGRGVEEVR
jgi:O-antigen ligase